MASAESSITPSSNDSTLIIKKKPMPSWFKLLAFFAVLALMGVTAGILFTEKWVDVVDHQLESLRNHDIVKAYQAYTSKDFQTTTSLDQFSNFIQAYPVFFNNQSAHFSERSIDHHIRTLKGSLTSHDHITTPIEYKLVKEEGKWKILSIRLLKPNKIQNRDEANHSDELIEVAKEQLKHIQDKNLQEAYQHYSSNEFKETTSEEAFDDFIHRYPILIYYHIASFHTPIIRHGIGTLSVILQSEQVAAYVKYYFIYENQEWKIWSMRILSPSEKQKKEEEAQSNTDSKEESMSVEAMTLGDEMDQMGKIKEPKTLFPSDLGDLYVDIQIKNGIKGSIIHLNLQQIDTKSSIPAKAAIEEDGHTMLMSVFSPPINGWPKGNYTLVATTPSGLSKTIDFEIK